MRAEITGKTFFMSTGVTLYMKDIWECVYHYLGNDITGVWSRKANLAHDLFLSMGLWMGFYQRMRSCHQ